HARGGAAVEQGPGLAGDESHPQPLPDQARIPRGPVDRPREQAHLVGDRRVVRAYGRTGAAREETAREPPVAADEPEAVALAADGVDGRPPIGLRSQRARPDAPAPAARDEGDRDVVQAPGAALQ